MHHSCQIRKLSHRWAKNLENSKWNCAKMVGLPLLTALYNRKNEVWFKYKGSVFSHVFRRPREIREVSVICPPLHLPYALFKNYSCSVLALVRWKGLISVSDYRLAAVSCRTWPSPTSIKSKSLGWFGEWEQRGWTLQHSIRVLWTPSHTGKRGHRSSG